MVYRLSYNLDYLGRFIFTSKYPRHQQLLRRFKVFTVFEKESECLVWSVYVLFSSIKTETQGQCVGVGPSKQES